MSTDENIQRNCKRFREEAGISQQDAANAAKISVDAIRNWEQGRRTPERDSLIALSRLYGRPVDDFFLEEPPAKRANVVPSVEFEAHFKNVKGVTLPEIEADLEALRRKWPPEKIAELMKQKKELKGDKKK